MAGSRPRPIRDALLAQAKQTRRAETNKLSRLRRQGINVTTIDSRPDAASLDTMTPRQLRAQIARSTRFTDRSNSYVPGQSGTPLSGATWRDYQRAETAANRAASGFYTSIKDLPIPGTGGTVADRLEDRSNRFKPGDYRTFTVLQRGSTGIVDQDALRALVKQMQNRADPRYLANEARLQRRIVDKMLARTSNTDLIPLVRDMDDRDIITLAQYTDFMPALESSYAMAKSTSTDRPSWQSSVYEDNEEKIQELVEWMHKRNTPTSVVIDDTARPATPAQPGRDRYGRFVGREANPTPEFTRDEQGRFTSRN